MKACVLVLYLIVYIIREYDLLAFLDLLRIIFVTDSFHAARIASGQSWLVIVPAAIILMLDTEWFDLEANNSGKIGVNVSVVQDCEAEVVVQ